MGVSTDGARSSGDEQDTAKVSATRSSTVSKAMIYALRINVDDDKRTNPRVRPGNGLYSEG
jgi:hypothetical protein